MSKQELVVNRVNELKVHRKQELRNSGKNPLVSVPPKCDETGFMTHRKSRNDKNRKRGPNKRTTQKLELVACA